MVGLCIFIGVVAALAWLITARPATPSRRLPHDVREARRAARRARQPQQPAPEYHHWGR